jgi:hypothetical protein
MYIYINVQLDYVQTRIHEESGLPRNNLQSLPSVQYMVHCCLFNVALYLIILMICLHCIEKALTRKKTLWNQSTLGFAKVSQNLWILATYIIL